MKKAVVIVGPTAVGKTDLSIRLAKKYHGEIISGDSMQVYRKLDIGTAKILPDEMQGIRHHLLDTLDVTQAHTVHDFQQEANSLIEDIYQRQHLPLIVGGTGFYINALISNLNLGGDQIAEQSHAVRERYENLAKKQGNQVLWHLLAQKDPQAANNIPVANTRRLIRALEVLDLTGSSFSKQKKLTSPYEFLVIGLNTQRKLLYQRINQRVDWMMQQGLEQEAAWLYQNAPSSQASQAIGYKEFFTYLAGDATKEQAIELVKRNSRRFAKRQLTYFRNQMTVQWYDILQNPAQIKLIEQVIQKFWEE
ncbi:tRNA (adenosine(37)-N6)-dimethylallyltransferase MiaA [Bombilactobacillus thymidiniphilus]|uniref:tRNA dimethylallyltransferase n=1 Tax=Bombilactobacillus thymidiniphilus TaxID=2923363 RepID=A0ABY4PD12_9LACO|nr:tRNA (adenosine(37)-N6)-dimethylallyltransferase MiaA [Bombilactobacillus thymidiniphilus]UQS83391.1 tRNA (adenosine(37)-N6)-dimethylallyltransferase MiaA [Bombilactobacillus thymidiniphilus]